MKLNPDCVRDILLTIEEITDNDTTVTFTDQNLDEFKKLSSYTHEEVFYHLRQCDLSDFFTRMDVDILGNWEVEDLSPGGHAFLADIRKDTVWNGIKGVAQKVGTTSLSALTQIASNVITELIKAQFGLSGMPPQIM